MDEFREVINSNFTTLCDLTKVTNRFLDRCCEQNIITRCDKDTLDAIPEGYGRNREFYKMVLKVDIESFLKLLKIMEEQDTRQANDVLIILKNQSYSGLPIPCSSIPLHTNQLKRKNSESESQNIWFEVGEPVTSFVGRKRDLVKLHEYVMRNSDKDVSSVTVISQLTSVSGLGGIGKTTLARKYARSYADYFDQNVIWINAETSSSMEASFTRLAEEIDVHIKNEKNLITRDKIYKFLETRKCLLIFDNVESYDGPNGVQRYLPRNPAVNANKPYILMTSRNWRILQTCKVLELGVLTEEESISFVKQRLESEYEGTLNLELIQKLVKKLEYLPLALQQAVAYIRNLQQELELSGEARIDPIGEYLRLLEEDSTSIHLLAYEFAPETGDDYEYTVLSTWNITITKVKSLEFGELALEFMKLIAYFEPDDIRCSSFCNTFEKKKIESATNVLKKYSMIAKSRGVISVHRLVQHVIRIQNKHEECELLRSCLKIVAKEIPKSGKLKQHITSIWKYSLEYPELVSEFSRVGLQLSDECNHKEMYERYLTCKNTGYHYHGLELLAQHVKKYHYKSRKKYLTKLVEELETQVPNAVSGWRNSLQNKTLSEWNIYRMECFAFNIKATVRLSRELYTSASDIHQINFDCYKLEKFPLEKEFEVGILEELSKLEHQDKYVATLNEFFGLTFISDEYKVLHKTALDNIISKFIKEFKYADISLYPNLQPLLQDQVNQLIRRIKNSIDQPESTSRNVEEHVLTLVDLIYCFIVLNEGYEDLLKYSKDLSKLPACSANSEEASWCISTEKRLDFLFQFFMTALSNRCPGRNRRASTEMVEICISIWKSTHKDLMGNNSKKLIEFVHAQMGMKGVKLICTSVSSVLSSADNCIWQIQKIDSVAFELVDAGKKYEEIERNSFVQESLQICEFVSKLIGDAHDCTSNEEKMLIYVSNRTNFMYASLDKNQIKDVLKYSDELHTFLCTVSIKYYGEYSKSILKKLEKLGAFILFKVNQANLQISTAAYDLKNATIKIYKCTWVYILNIDISFHLESIVKHFVQFGRDDEFTNLSKEMHSRSNADYLELSYLALNLAYNLLKVGKNGDIESVAFEEARNIYTLYRKSGRSNPFSDFSKATNQILSVTMELKVEGALECLQYICEDRDEHELMPTNSELQELSHSLLQQAINDGDRNNCIRLIEKIRDTFCCIYKKYYLVNIKKHVSMTAFDSKPLVKCYIELEDLEGMQKFSSDLKLLHPAAKENEQLHWIVQESFASNLRDLVSGKENFKFREQFLREADSIFELVQKHAKL